jgi:hypothetical protein
MAVWQFCRSSCFLFASNPFHLPVCVVHEQFKELDLNLHYPQLVSMSFCTQSDRAIVF